MAANYMVWKGFLESIVDWEFHVSNYRHLLLKRCIEFIWLELFKHVRATLYSLHYSLVIKFIRFFLCILKWDFNGFWIWNIANWTVLMREVLNRSLFNLFIRSTNIKTYALHSQKNNRIDERIKKKIIKKILKPSNNHKIPKREKERNKEKRSKFMIFLMLLHVCASKILSI